MKKFVFSAIVLATLLAGINVQAASVVTDPSSGQTIQPTASGFSALSIQGGAGNQSALYVSNSEYDAIHGVSTYGAGLYAYSQESLGLVASSLNGSSALLYPSASQNTQPTLVIQSMGGTAAHIETQSAFGVRQMSIDSNGKILADAGIKLPSSGSCSSSNRREMKVVEGGAGVADQLQVCLKDAAGNYAWVTK